MTKTHKNILKINLRQKRKEEQISKERWDGNLVIT